MSCIVWLFWFWLFSCENVILIWCWFAISTFLCQFLIWWWHRWFSSSHTCWNVLFCVTNKLIHIFQKYRSCHGILFIKRKWNECVSKLYNSFLWIFYKSINLCCSQNWLLWFLFSICQSIPTSRHWKTDIIWMT